MNQSVMPLTTISMYMICLKALYNLTMFLNVNNKRFSSCLGMNHSVLWSQILSCPADPERIPSLALLRAFTLFSIQL